MNTLVSSLKEEAHVAYTENGMKAVNTTGSACLDLFSTIGALRQEPKWGEKADIQADRAERLFAEAYKENPLIATRILFYARDIREGLGERDVVRHLFQYAAKYHPEALKANLDLIGLYGRYDDLYRFIGTPLEEDMWEAMKAQFEADIHNMKAGSKNVSLLAKWIKTPDASSRKTRELGILTALKLGYSVYDFKRKLKQLRKYIGVVESRMSAQEWKDIQYSSVPSRAMMIYRNSFERHDGKRFAEYISKALRGEEKINSGTLYPYDIAEKYLYKHENSDVLEAQWRQLPDYAGDENIIVMADVSGSMSGRPMASSVGLALYFAERNKGDFHNLFMTFSSNPEICEIRGETLSQKFDHIIASDWGMSTNIESAFNLILERAVEDHVPAGNMPKVVVIISDMEFNEASYEDDWDFYQMMEDKYKKAGYSIPNIVFWNVASRHETFHSTSDRKGVTMVSGHSTSTFKTLINCLDRTPVEMMMDIINSERYMPVTIS